MIAAGDAPGITIPYAMLPSKDESKDDVEKWEKGLKVPHLVEWFPSQIHGWMAARGDLEDEDVKKEYERGYKTLLDFFHKHMWVRGVLGEDVVLSASRDSSSKL